MTEGELYDFLRERFGVGDYDEALSGQPYWKYRALEVSKLKGIIRRRRTSVAELYLAAEYAAERRIPISAPFDLLRLIGPAKKAAMVPRRRELAERLERAARDAQAMGQAEWATRLFVADVSAAEELLAEWERVAR